jgi:hypothetical protein
MSSCVAFTLASEAGAGLQNYGGTYANRSPSRFPPLVWLVGYAESVDGLPNTAFHLDCLDTENPVIQLCVSGWSFHCAGALEGRARIAFIPSTVSTSGSDRRFALCLTCFIGLAVAHLSPLKGHPT